MPIEKILWEYNLRAKVSSPWPISEIEAKRRIYEAEIDPRKIQVRFQIASLIDDQAREKAEADETEIRDLKARILELELEKGRPTRVAVINQSLLEACKEAHKMVLNCPGNWENGVREKLGRTIANADLMAKEEDEICETCPVKVKT